MKTVIPVQIEEILRKLENAGFEAYIVGGCVRDSLMGLCAHDYDITTSAMPEETERVFSDCRVIETGIKHGTVTVLYKGMSSEITTFRIDGEYPDGRHPEKVTFSRDLTDDLSRRDFTMNAIAFSPARGIIDPFGGEADIRARLIRAVGDPEKRFSEDALRILRALRFSSVLGFDIEENTKRALLEKRSMLRKVSHERTFSELKRLLCGENAQQTLLDFPEVITEIIPELAAQVGFEQGSKYHDSTLYVHTARAVGAAPRDTSMRLAMLLHDVAKPECKTVGEDGESHYYRHAALGADKADEILRGLKCDNLTRVRVREIIRYHDLPVELSEGYIRRQLSKRGPELFRDIILAHIADDSAKSPLARARIDSLEKALALADEIQAQKPCLTLKTLAVNGGDLKKFMEPSPKMGEILAELLNEVVDGKLENDREALLARAKELI